MNRLSVVLLTTAAVAAVVACGKGENSLDGSLSEVFDLDVSKVDVLRNDDALAVVYTRNSGRDIDLVLRFTLALDQLPLQKGKTVKMAGFTDAGTLRAAFLHNAAGEPARVLPPVSIGEFTLDKGGNPGDDTSGSFSASFGTGDYASGRAVSGRFRGTARDAGYGDWVP